jgi:DNA-binding response OmpR family regulator
VPDEVILVDSFGNRSLVLEELLTKSGFHVTRVDPHGGTCPLCSSDAAALVIVSLTVGVGTGMALVRCMSVGSHVPILVLGSGRYEGEAAAAEAVGASSFIPAPYSLVEVVNQSQGLTFRRVCPGQGVPETGVRRLV